MMTDKISPSNVTTKVWRDLVYIALVGTGFGLLGGFVQKEVTGIGGAAILLFLFGAYNSVLENNRGLMSGLLTGGIIGLIVGVVGFLLGGIPNGVLEAALFGFVRGMLFGAMAGFITRAKPDEGDASGVALFLIAGSIVVGAFLGAAIGLLVGVILGLVMLGGGGVLVAVLVGLIVGGYLGTYFLTRRLVIISAVIFSSVSLISAQIGGAFTGLVLGLVGGALTPMLLVAAIGLLGGLTSRGLKAGIIEALEAPAEMIQQGAAPFLAPAMLVGIIVGAAAVGEGGVIALTITLAGMGLFLGVISELERPQANRLTIRALIEMVMLGSDQWPIREIAQQVSGTNKRTAVFGGLIAFFLASLSALIGALVGQQLKLLVDMIMS
ncbi:MAG: hypothetical protein GY796_18390 [Chloroflexi bacterium]|nr:hypothetical protein [Chloroflexota bacterium]